ncbi:DUF1572 family protein [Aestuariibaculum sediminum]|uniref:DUF1572 family protein n=1 Tax=Aestuariibaculum sediminum TaxID=2770637 RepID=UPI00293BD339|nr:DUF1572 family protein [Aestuariibaculum sediminum]
MIPSWKNRCHCLFKAIKPIESTDLESIIFIRNEGHTVFEAISRQLSYYAYHVGQIDFLGKLPKGDQWQSVSFTKGQSSIYNQKNSIRKNQESTLLIMFKFIPLPLRFL